MVIRHRLLFFLIVISVIIVINLSATFVLAAPEQTPIKGYVNDYANILTVGEEQELSAMLENLQKTSKAELSVVTISSLDGYEISDYAFNLANTVLGDKEKNNGLLLLVATKERKYRFEVGRGLEPELPDLLVRRIGEQQLVPAFKEQKYGQGIKNALVVIEKELTDGVAPAKNNNTSVSPVILMIISLGFALFMISFFIAVSKQSYQQSRLGKGMSKDTRTSNDVFSAALIAAMFMRGGRGGMGGSSFGGFGGGSFGGGGAGGSF